MRAGNFYSTRGPEFLAIERDGDCVVIETSPVRFVRLVGPASAGMRIGSFDDKEITEAEFEIPPEWQYAYLEIEDARAMRAWSNPLFKAESQA